MRRHKKSTKSISRKGSELNTVLVTGAGGFIGSHLAERLAVLGNRVTAFVRYNSKNTWGWLDESDQRSKMKIIAGDIRDFDSVSRAMQGCDTVFHLAALIGIPYSYVSPLAYIKTNIEGTYNVLEAARAQRLKQVVITSTSETYGTAQSIPISENHPLVGQSPYSASKIAADQLALSYYRSFDLPVRIVRPFNTFGPRQSPRAIIPTIILQLLSGSKEISLGNVTPTRDLTFVKDTVEGFIEVSNAEELTGEVVNVGMKTEISVADLFDAISGLMGIKAKIKSDEKRQRPEKSEVERLICDNAKLKRQTHWSPKYDLKKGLLETVEFLRAHGQTDKLHYYTI